MRRFISQLFEYFGREEKVAWHVHEKVVKDCLQQINKLKMQRDTAILRGDDMVRLVNLLKQETVDLTRQRDAARRG